MDSILRVGTLVCVGQFLLVATLAQAGANDTVPAPNISIPLRSPVSTAPAPPAPVPPLPLSRSPIAFFRELLAMDATAREHALTNRSPEARILILAKVREYESLEPADRELRLRATELRWYLRPLMSSPATNRPAQLASIPESYRKLVEDRLQEWDKLPPDLQKELLANEATIRYLTEIEGRTDEQRRQALEAIPPAGRTALEQGIDKLSSMSEDQRWRMFNRFKEFFELTAQEQQRVLNTLSGPDRGQAEKTVRAFDNLPPDQRDECIRAFAKFAGLSPAERQQFLKNAERWKQMSPSERQVWRVLVSRLPPPLPPPLPHVRPSSRPVPPVPSVATNGN